MEEMGGSIMPRRARGLRRDCRQMLETAGEQLGNNETLEVQSLAQQLLEKVFEQKVAEDVAFPTLDLHPEIAWLAHCAYRCPLPPCWTRSETAGDGSDFPKYLDPETGEESPTPPLLPHFAVLGKLACQARQGAHEEAIAATAALAQAAKSFAEEASLTRTSWDGPHIDVATGSEYWHCAAVNRSTWGDPGAAADFLARVAERLAESLRLPIWGR